MPASYSIGKHFELFVQEQVRSGEYASASEVVRDGLRLLEARKQYRQAKLAALQREIRAGLEGPTTPAQDVITAARARITKASGKKSSAR